MVSAMLLRQRLADNGGGMNFVLIFMNSQVIENAAIFSRGYPTRRGKVEVKSVPL
jgi:hypothetical protein